MKRVSLRSKEPTIQRMLSLTANLHEKFNCHCSIDLIATTYFHSGESLYKFWIYIELKGGEYHDTWPELLKRYKELMNE